MRILRGVVDELSLRGDILAIGGSTSAYFVDSMSEFPRSDLREKDRDACGCVNLYFESWSGAKPRSSPHRKLTLLGGCARTIGYY